MEILVLVKEVPDMNKVTFDQEKGVVRRSAAKGEMNPFDENALQAALDLKNIYGGTVTVISMGPPKAEITLRDAYSRGADKCVLLTDRAFGGADTLATSVALSEAIKNNDFDLILCGEKSVDGDTAQVGAEVAQLLDIPHAYYVEQIRKNSEWIQVEIENLSGKKQTRSMRMPALVSVTKNIGKLKLATVRKKLESMEVDVEIVGIDKLKNITSDNVGFSGSPTKVSKIHIPKEEKRESKIYRDSLNTFEKEIKKVLTNRGCFN